MTGFDTSPLEEQAGWPEGLPDHLSYTSLTQWHRCPNQFYWRVIKDRKEPPKSYRVWGIADSKAAEKNYRQKIDTHQDLPVGDVKDEFIDTVEKQIEEAGGKSQIEWEEPLKTVKDRGVEMVSLYHQEVAPRVQPRAAELEFNISLPGVPVPIIGFIDVETDATLIERKTGKRAWSKGTPAGNYLMQALIYQLAVPKPVHWHLSTKTQRPAVYTPDENPSMSVPYTVERTRYTERWVRSTVRSIIAMMNTFGPDEEWPGHRAVSMGPCGFCGYRPYCTWWKES